MSGTRIPLRVPSCGVMMPPTLHQTALMAMPSRTGRGWMEIDPKLPAPSVARVLRLFAGIGAFLLWVGWLHG